LSSGSYGTSCTTVDGDGRVTTTKEEHFTRENSSETDFNFDNVQAYCFSSFTSVVLCTVAAVTKVTSTD